jgi:phosphotransferase system enzyme I (PtsP)
LRLIAEQARAAECPVTICGEIGGKPLEALALIGLGFSHLSMSPASIGPVKAMIIETHAARIAALLDDHLGRPDSARSLRPALAHFAEKHGIPHQS